MKAIHLENVSKYFGTKTPMRHLFKNVSHLAIAQMIIAERRSPPTLTRDYVVHSIVEFLGESHEDGPTKNQLTANADEFL